MRSRGLGWSKTQGFYRANKPHAKSRAAFCTHINFSGISGTFSLQKFFTAAILPSRKFIFTFNVILL